MRSLTLLEIRGSPTSVRRAAYPKIRKLRIKCMCVVCPENPEPVLLYVHRDPPSACSPTEKHRWWHVFTRQDVPQFALKNSRLGYRHLWGWLYIKMHPSLHHPSYYRVPHHFRMSNVYCIRTKQYDWSQLVFQPTHAHTD